MTLDECEASLSRIRSLQGTRFPLLRVRVGETRYEGRLIRSDSDHEHRPVRSSPYGLLVLTDPGLSRRPELLVQIADIPPDGIEGEEPVQPGGSIGKAATVASTGAPSTSIVTTVPGDA